RDELRFLAEVQHHFARDTYRFLRMLGFRGVIAASGTSPDGPALLRAIDLSTAVVTDAVVEPGDVPDGSADTGRDPGPGGRLGGFLAPSAGLKGPGKAALAVGTGGVAAGRWRPGVALRRAAFGGLWGNDAVVFSGLASRLEFPGAALMFRRAAI